MSKQPSVSFVSSLYHFQPVCQALIHDGAAQANAIFCEQLKALPGLADRLSEQDRIKILHRLNQSLYHFILFHWKLSLHELCEEMENTAFSLPCQCELENAAQQMICAYCTELSRRSCGNQYISRAADYIEQHMSGDLSLPRVASHVFVCSAYLSELFPACTGKKFCEYVAYRRIERAKELLRTTRFSVQEISQQCGFGSSSYFSCVFSKHTGLSPRSYRTFHADACSSA